MGSAVRVGTGVAIAWLVSASAWSAGAPLRILGLDVRRGPDSVAVVVATDRAIKAPVSALRSAAGDLQRLYVDLPAETILAEYVQRIVPGEPPIHRVALGRVGGGGSRVVIDVRGATTFVVRKPPTGHGIAVVVAVRSEQAAPRVRAEPERADTSDGAAARARRALRIVLDPGHGGDDPGATGVIEEKTVTLAIARRLGALLRNELGAAVTLTRDADYAVSLPERTRRANLARGDLFISIHANASPRPGARGIETYSLDNTSDHATLRLAAIENGGGTAGSGTDLDRILSSLVQGGKQEPSVRLARHVQGEVVGRLRRGWKNVVDLGVKQGPFYVLVGAYMPCILVEASFLTHAEEGRRLADPTYQHAIAEGIYRGIVSFVETRASDETL